MRKVAAVIGHRRRYTHGSLAAQHLMAFPSGSNATEFNGLAIPEGVEKRVLYHSTYRAIATYAMSLADLDRELQGLLHARGCTIKEDARRNLGGKSTRRRRACACAIFPLKLALCSRIGSGHCHCRQQNRPLAHRHLRQYSVRAAKTVDRLLTVSSVGS